MYWRRRTRGTRTFLFALVTFRTPRYKPTRKKTMKDCQLLQIMIFQMLAGKYNVKGLEAFRIGFATPLASSAQELD